MNFPTQSQNFLMYYDVVQMVRNHIAEEHLTHLQNPPPIFSRHDRFMNYKLKWGFGGLPPVTMLICNDCLVYHQYIYMMHPQT